MFTKLRELLGLETNQERLFRYEELNKSFDEVSKQLDSLADIFFTERKRYINRLQNPDNLTIQKSIKSRFNNFLEVHKEEVRNARKEYFKIEKEVKKLEKSLGDEITNRKTYDKIKKAYKSGLLSLEDFNEAAKRITKEGKTKYADFLLFNEKGELLLLKRSKWEDDLKGSWVIPGGHVDLGEEFEAAALRELWEESGFRPDQYKNVGNYIDDNVEIEYYQGTVNTTEQSPLLDFNETSEYRWICLDDIDDYEMIFNMRENIKRILGLPDKPHKVTIRKSEEEEVEKGLYKQAISELYALINKRNSLIEKSGDSITVQFLDQIIEKAVKDISKLNQIRKLIYRDGKLIFATYYVKTGNEIEDEKKKNHSGKIKLDIEEGKSYKVAYKHKGKSLDVKGIVTGFRYLSQRKLNFFCLVDDATGEKHWLTANNVSSIRLAEEQASVEEYDKNGYKFLKNLGGSTGAVLVQDKWGNQFVQKTGANKEHIKAEEQALRLYQHFGVKVPGIHKFDEEQGILWTYYLPDAIPIDPNDSNTKKEISKDFIVDALLANWDVVGLANDNILKVKYNGWFFRVDVGGSLNKRAQGEDKLFGEEVTELDTLLDPNINPNTAKLFQGVDVQQQIYDLVENYESQTKSSILRDGNISPANRDIIDKRINYLKTKLKPPQTKEEELEQLNFDGKLYDLQIDEHDDFYSKNLVEFYDKLNQYLKFDEEDLEELKHIKRFKSEKESKQYLEKELYGNLTHPIIQEGLKRGVTFRELVAIRDYTSHYYSEINAIASSVCGTDTGNFNFDQNPLSEPVTKIEKVKKEKYFNFEDSFDQVLSAVKSINFAKDSGKTAGEANLSKIQTSQEISAQLKEMLSLSLDGKLILSKTENQSVDFLNDMVHEIGMAIAENRPVKQFEKPYFIKNKGLLNYQVEIEKEVITPGVKMNFNILKDKSGNLSKLKLIVSGLRKLERIKNKNFYIQGLFNRGIDTNKYGDKFDKEHDVFGEYVTHGWGGSSAYKSKGFGKDTLLKISGAGVYIDTISAYEGEKEVLNRPFTLFKTTGFEAATSNSKKIVHLLKVV